MVSQSSVRGASAAIRAAPRYFREVRAGEGPEPLSARLGSGRTPPRSDDRAREHRNRRLRNFEVRTFKPEDVRNSDSWRACAMGQLVLTMPPE